MTLLRRATRSALVQATLRSKSLQVRRAVEREVSSPCQLSDLQESLITGKHISRLLSTSPQPKPVKDVQSVQNDPDHDTSEEEKRGAIGGFMRGLVGGNEVAAEDMYVAQAKKEGREVPPPPSRESRLVAVKRRRRREEEEGSTEEEQSIRDRIFSRFAGSSFMKGAFEAKEKISESIEESDNPIINFFRNIYDRLFAENEMGQVLGEIRRDDPAFNISDFVHHVHKDLIPTILKAYLEGNRKVLKKSCTEDAYRMLNASLRERQTGGIVMDTNILDIDDVELTAARFLEDSPVLIVSFTTQQINCVRNTEGVILEGAEDDIRAVYYIWAFIREPELEDAEWNDDDLSENEEETAEAKEEQKNSKASESTNSSSESENTEKSEKDKLPPWKMMEMVIRGAHSTI